MNIKKKHVLAQNIHILYNLHAYLYSLTRKREAWTSIAKSKSDKSAFRVFMFLCIFKILLVLSQGQDHHNSIRLRAVPKEKGLRKGRIIDNTVGNEIPVAHTTQNSHWSKSMCPSIKSELHNTLDCDP